MVLIAPIANITKGERLMLCKNEVVLRGWILVPFELHHVTEEVQIFRGIIRTRRQSGAEDVLPVHITKELLDTLERVPELDDFIELKGAFHSRNVYGEDKKKHLQLYVQIKSIAYSDATVNSSENMISLSGLIINRGNTRTTTSGRTVIDFQVATFRHTNRRSCIPCIAWGKKTELVEGLQRDDAIGLKGRIQSREYTKFEDGEYITRTAYEVSVTDFVEEIE